MKTKSDLLFLALIFMLAVTLIWSFKPKEREFKRPNILVPATLSLGE